MRRALIATFLLAALVPVGSASSAQTADEGMGGGKTATLNITKVVDGDGPTGGYVIEYTCTSAKSIEGGSAGSLAFDAAGPGSPETQTIVITEAVTCTVNETESNGADSVSYTCEFTPGEPPSSPGSFGGDTEGFPTGSCLDDRSGVILAPDEVLDITVTNTFDADVLPDDDEPDADADVVDATPAFTG